MATAPLGEFEVVVLMAVLHGGTDAYGAAIRDEIETRTGRPVARGAVYITLDRLADKGLLTSTIGDPTPARGGRPKRLYTVTPAGLRAVKQAVRLVSNMHRGLEAVLGKI